MRGCCSHGIDDEGNVAVLDVVNDMWAPFGHFEHRFRIHPVFPQISRSAAGRLYVESEPDQMFRHLEGGAAVALLDTNECGTTSWQRCPGAGLRFGEGPPKIRI